MKIGITVRNMGPQSTPELMRSAVTLAEQAQFESAWITDHIAIPPDDAEGSGGRYTDPLTTLAWLGGQTTSIKLGTGVLILPYRPPLPTAKAIATVAEFTGKRLLLGVGVGWMEPEFKALGIDRSERGSATDQTIEFLQRCFNDAVVTSNGQPFLFDPKPPMPPLYIGGAAPHALQRALRTGSGWLPMVRGTRRLEADLQLYSQLAEQMDTTTGPVTAMGAVDCKDPSAGAGLLNAYHSLGLERMVCALRYDTLDQFKVQLEALQQARAQAALSS